MTQTKNDKRKISDNRVRKIRNPKSKIIIAAEGRNKTERIYFNNFDIGSKNYSISMAKGDDTDPLNLVKNLGKEIKKLGLNLNDGDKAYCVFDVDLDPSKDKVIAKARDLALQYGIEIITSTPCIELWFLLHFKYTAAMLSNAKVVKELKEYYPKYSKTTNIFLDIKDNTNMAIKRAKRLENYQLENNKIIGTTLANPNTEIYKIVEYLIQHY